ncbi:hypothetical protein [Streptomyces sp. JJ38]|uniref:hypothetical protein n=1 Tax=Streptomyces sp. JJ38 TaxID=2738128 RepID=UPI001C59736D|nr:hypothetical protein [Streptomyces sp. JJ38]MBW1597821.1 hypothetical protein [Streptomyces sp. JJ38]
MAEEPGRDSGKSDEEWAAFLRDSASGQGSDAAPKEPSARARMVAGRLRELDEAAARQQPKRRWWGGKREPEPWQPEGWRTGPAWREMQGGRRGGRAGRWVAGFVALCAVCWGAVHYLDDAKVDLDTVLSGGSDEPAEPLPAETGAPSAAPEHELLSDLPTLAEPFAGSPAERWAGGAEAIVLPEARAVGGVSAERVSAKLVTLKKFLVAANLDPAVVNGGAPEDAIALLAPEQKEMADLVEAALEDPTPDNNATAWFSRFDPSEARLIGDTVKVRGRMELSARGEGRAAIRADYTFVYPVESVRRPGEVTRTVVRRVLEVEVVDPQRWLATPGRLWVTEYIRDVGNTACGVHDGLLHPEFPSDLMDNPQPTGPTADPYDRSKTLDELQSVQNGECGAVSRV